MPGQSHDIPRRVAKLRCRCKAGAAKKCTDMSDNEKGSILKQFWHLKWKEKLSNIISLE